MIAGFLKHLCCKRNCIMKGKNVVITFQLILNNIKPLIITCCYSVLEYPICPGESVMIFRNLFL